VWGTARLAAESSTIAVVGDPLILSGQKPRIQDFFANSDDNNATFTVSITNTGSVPFQSVSVTGATAPDCNRDDLGALAPGASTSYVCEQEDVGESFLNELQVNGATDTTTVSHHSNAFVKVLRSEVRITKTPTTQTVRRGATAAFTVTLYNPTDEIMTVVGVDDTVDKCDLEPTVTINLPPKESIDYACFLDKIQAPQATVATGRLINPVTTQQYAASDVAWVELLDLSATLTPQQTTIPEPGNEVTFTVDLVNTGSVPVTLTGLTADRFGNILDPNNPLVEEEFNACLPQPTLPTLQPYGGSYRCTFRGAVSGQPSNFGVTLTATARDQNNLSVTASAGATVAITDVPSSIALTLGAKPPFINPPSRLVTFSVQVKNTSEVDVITVTEMEDEFLGSLNGRGTCVLPVEGISPGFSFQCTFTTVVTGEAGQQRSRTISVTAVDDDTPPSTLVADDVITVGVTDREAQELFMPNITDDTVEPNDSCSRPYPLRLNRQYFFLPPDVYPRDQDYFSFELTQATDVRVELTNFVPRRGQIVIRKGEGCLTVVDRNPNESLNKFIDLGQLEPGRYFIQIINDNATMQNIRELYGLIVRVD
jgi:hypothetical protein